MRIVIISDTHGRHEALGTLSGDVLIHCGDQFNLWDGEKDCVRRMDDWFARQDFDRILCIGGNHDLILQSVIETEPQPFRHAIYLQDAQYEYGGLTFYGAPWTPKLRGHAFYQDDAGLQDKWAMIPTTTDVLITHTPAFSVLDKSSRGLTLGCLFLGDTLARVRPKVHCFGHVHNSAGRCVHEGIDCINASTVNSQLKPVHPPVVVEL
ncbi:MAG: metallophosphatase domain-containing protein [Pseudomonadota bacterium]